MELYFRRDEDGAWKSNRPIENDNWSFLTSTVEYLNILDPFFEQAQDKCEFEFILCLLRYRGNHDPGWDPFENLVDVFEGYKKVINSRMDDITKTHYSLFVYGLIIEAAAPYELLANLINVIEGGRYTVDNFPDRQDKKNNRSWSQSPLEKISQLKTRAKKIGLSLDLFDEFVDKHLRNAVFHSDYSIRWPKIRTMDPIHEYEHKEWMVKINKTLAYLDALLHLYRGYILAAHREPRLIDPHPGFGHKGKVTTIVREGHGVIGMKDTLTKEEIAQGRIPYRIGLFLPYEIPLIEDGQVFFPPNQIDRFNQRIKYLPPFLKRYLVKKYRGKFGV